MFPLGDVLKGPVNAPDATFGIPFGLATDAYPNAPAFGGYNLRLEVKGCSVSDAGPKRRLNGFAEFRGVELDTFLDRRSESRRKLMDGTCLVRPRQP